MSGPSPNLTPPVDPTSPYYGTTPDCFNITDWYLMGVTDLRLICVSTATLAILVPLAIALVLFSTPVARSSVLFSGSLLAVLCTIAYFGLSLYQEISSTIQPNTLFTGYISKEDNSITLAARFFQQLLPWMWDTLFLLKVLAFYPPSLYPTVWRRYTHLSLPIITKLRLPIDIATYVLTVQLVVDSFDDDAVYSRKHTLERKLYLASMILRLIDNVATASLLIGKSIAFYHRAAVRLSPAARRIRVLVESVVMSAVCIVPIQFAQVVFFSKLVFENDDVAQRHADFLIVLDIAATAVLGLFATVWSSIASTPLQPVSLRKSTGTGSLSGWINKLLGRFHRSRASVSNIAESSGSDPEDMVECPVKVAPALQGPGGHGVGGTAGPTETLLSIFYAEHQSADDKGATTAVWQRVPEAQAADAAWQRRASSAQWRHLPLASSRPSSTSGLDKEAV